MFCDYELRNWSSSWYVHTDITGKSWMAEVGILAETGEFFRLATSNIVTTPRHELSERFDQSWAYPLEDVFLGGSSIDLERNLNNWLSSGGISSSIFAGSGPKDKKS